MSHRERQAGTAGEAGHQGRAAPGPPPLACLAVVLLAVVLYLPALGHEFVWDDTSILMANPRLLDWSQLGSNLTSGFFEETSTPQRFDYWRPLVVLSHMVDRSLFGDAAWGPHLVNLLLHAVASLLVMLLAHAWTRHPGCSLLAGLAFATHPVHVEVVAWVSGRSDLLFGVFFALALLADKLYGSTGEKRWLAVSLGAFVAALSSKEAAVVFPLLVAARAALTDAPGGGDGAGEWRRTMTAPLSSLVALSLFLWVRFALVAAELPATVTDPAHRAAMFWTWWSAFLRYLELLVLPLKLTILHDVELVEGGWSPRALLGLTVCAVLVWSGWRLRRAPAAAFGIVTLLVGLVPFSNFVFPVSAQAGAAFPLAERFLYVPSIGFCVLAGWVLAVRLPRRPRRLVGLLAYLLILAAATRAHVRVGDWASDLRLFAAAARDSPGSYLAHLNYASALVGDARRESSPEAGERTLMLADRHYQEALELAPENFRVHYDLGNLYRSSGRLIEAENAYRRALRLHPRLAQARINLGAVLVESGDPEAALAEFEAAERLLPKAVAPKVNRAHVLQMLGRPEQAIPLYVEALRLEPGLAAAVDGLARARQAIAAAESVRGDS